MNIKTPQTLIDEANKEIKTISAEQALELVKNNKCNLIDLREEGELVNLGSVEKSTHIPRGLLEFSLGPNSPLVKNSVVDLNKETVLFFSLEMSSEQLAQRILSEQSGIDSHRIRKGDINDDEFSNISFDTETKLSRSFSDKFPLLISFELILACSDKILLASCSDDISNEKKSTLSPIFCEM